MSHRKFTCLAILLFSIVVNTAHAQERILSYHSEIDIAVDASMMVAETIRVRAEGQDIRRGIYRDFPTRYRDRFGNNYVVDFEVLAATRDGQAEVWRTENRANGVRVYLGSADSLLSPDEYSYEIRYRTNRQIGYFDDHDELYWNVTGNGWSFPIEQASATVNLPGDVVASDIAMEGYTGQFGQSGQAYTATVMDGGAHIETTAPLGRQSGLTLVMSWPVGLVDQPNVLQRIGYLLTDNLGLLLASITLLLAGFHLYNSWLKEGRDPQAGVIFPHYEPPNGYSPASMRYISRMKYDNKTLTTAIVNLAVKGYLIIRKDDKDYALQKAESTTSLAAGEQALLNQLFLSGDELELDIKNRSTIKKASTAHRKALRNDYLNVYFSRNSSLLLPSFIGSVIMLIVIVALDAILATVAILFAVNLLIHLLFLYLMQAPSSRGRRLLDKLEGFKLYLEVAEQDDLNLRNPPDKTPELFENYLPYAIALGVEQQWAEQFTAVFAALEAGGAVAYHPAWYHGDFHTMQLNSFTTAVGKSITTAITSAATPSGTTSGAGGGGSSGGGGGGGGGGGW